MLLNEFVNTPDGGLTATFAGFLAMVLSALTMAGWKWMNKNKDESHKNLIERIAAELDLDNEDSMIAKVNAMEAQLKTNGGGSIFDMVKKTHSELTELKSETYSIREQVENVIASTRARTELALDQSTTPQFIANDKGEIEYVNDAMTDLFGLGKAHFFKNKWLKVIDSQTSKEEVVRRLDFAVTRKIDTTIDKIPCKSKDERTFLVKITLEPKTDSKDRFLWYIGKVKEIKEEIKPKND